MGNSFLEHMNMSHCTFTHKTRLKHDVWPNHKSGDECEIIRVQEFTLLWYMGSVSIQHPKKFVEVNLLYKSSKVQEKCYDAHMPYNDLIFIHSVFWTRVQ